MGNPWRSARFRRHLAGQGEGDWPVAVMPTSAGRAIDARSQTVRLSRDTAIKQAARHPDLEPDDYALVQRILDEGELFRSAGGDVVGFSVIDGQLWRTVVKRTADRSETYLVSLHKAQPHNLDAARRRLKRIDRED